MAVSEQAVAVEGPEVSTVHFVVDTSGSMQGTSLEQAKAALDVGIDALGDHQQGGLREFSGSCGQGGELLTDIGLENHDALRAAVEGLTAGGGTPTPEALEAAAADLPDSGDRTIVLISDGQSTCGDPCPAAEAITHEEDLSLTVNTVGFGTGAAADNELSCIAEATGGTFLHADDLDELGEAISGAVQAPEHCPEVRLIGVRGSGQGFLEGEAFEEPLATFADQLASRLETEDPERFEKDNAIDVQSLDYDAVSADKALDAFLALARDGLLPGRSPDPTDGNEYMDSLSTGYDALRVTLSQFHGSACPDAEIVIAGYSQGAHVIGDVLGPTLDLDQVVAIRLFGDPRYNPHDATSLPGTVSNGGILGVRGTYEEGSQLVESWCIPGDPICDSGSSMISWNGLKNRVGDAFGKDGKHGRYDDSRAGGRVPALAAARSACQAIYTEPCDTLEFGRGLGPGYDDPSEFRGQVPWDTSSR